MFTFDGPVAESYLNQSDNSRVPSRLTSSSVEGDGASEAYDSDYKSCVINSYIEGVSFNSRLVIGHNKASKINFTHLPIRKW